MLQRTNSQSSDSSEVNSNFLGCRLLLVRQLNQDGCTVQTHNLLISQKECRSTLSKHLWNETSHLLNSSWSTGCGYLRSEETHKTSSKTELPERMLRTYATNGWNTGSCLQACSLEAGNYVWEMGHTAHLMDSAEGCKHKPQAADKQASVLWAAYCLYLQTSAAEFENRQKICHLLPQCQELGPCIFALSEQPLTVNRCTAAVPGAVQGFTVSRCQFLDNRWVESCQGAYLEGHQSAVVTSVVDNAIKTKKRKFAAHVFRALSTTKEEDITCGHTLTWKMNDHLDDVTLEHCSTVTSSRSIIFSIKRTATLAQTLAALLTLFGSQKRHTIKEMIVTDATKCRQYG